MKNRIRIIAAVLLAVIATNVKAQDKREMFNPIHTALVSQTIAPCSPAS